MAEGQQVATTAPQMLIPSELIMQAKHANEAVFENMAAGGYLPRMQLNASSSRLVQKGKCKLGTYVLVRGKDNIMQDYGEEFSCLVLGWRPKAVEFTESSAKNYFNPKTANFQRVEKRADEKPRPRGFLYGPEYLLYMPDVDSLALLHMNNPTMRLRAAEVKALIGQAATFRSELIEKASNIWPAPIITPCSTPLNLPAQGSERQQELFERIAAQREKFCNPPEEEVEEVPEEAEATPSASERPR